jgi:hypothetical protein
MGSEALKWTTDIVGDGITRWVGGDHMIGSGIGWEEEVPGGRWEHWKCGTEHKMVGGSTGWGEP